MFWTRDRASYSPSIATLNTVSTQGSDSDDRTHFVNSIWVEEQRKELDFKEQQMAKNKKIHINLEDLPEEVNKNSIYIKRKNKQKRSFIYAFVIFLLVITIVGVTTFLVLLFAA